MDTFSHISATSTHRDFTTRLTSSGEAGANGYRTGEVRRASIHHGKPTHGPILERSEVALMVADAVTPSRSAGNYFLGGGTHVSSGRRCVPPWGLSVLLSLRCSRVCSHDTFHISNKKKTKEKGGEKLVERCLNNGRKRRAALRRVAERGRDEERETNVMIKCTIPEMVEQRHPLTLVCT